VIEFEFLVIAYILLGCVVSALFWSERFANVLQRDHLK
jgi:hypothetical protein